MTKQSQRDRNVGLGQSARGLNNEHASVVTASAF